MSDTRLGFKKSWESNQSYGAHLQTQMFPDKATLWPRPASSCWVSQSLSEKRSASLCRTQSWRQNFKLRSRSMLLGLPWPNPRKWTLSSQTSLILRWGCSQEISKAQGTCLIPLIKWRSGWRRRSRWSRESSCRMLKLPHSKALTCNLTLARPKIILLLCFSNQDQPTKQEEGRWNIDRICT